MIRMPMPILEKLYASVEKIDNISEHWGLPKATNIDRLIIFERPVNNISATGILFMRITSLQTLYRIRKKVALSWL